MDNREKIVNTRSISFVVLELAVVFSVFSQIVPIERYARPGMYAFWIFLLLLGFANDKDKPFKDSFSLKYLIAYFLFFLFCCFMELFGRRYLTGNYIKVLLAPLLVTIVGGMFANEDKALFNRLGRLYLLCSIIFAIWVHRTYILSYTSWLNSRQYLFGSKNSAGQIWCAAIFISLFLLEYRSAMEKYIFYICDAYLFFLIGICQCRTTLLGIAIAVVSFVILKSKRKFGLFFLTMIVGSAAWFIPITHQFVEQALFLNKYADADMNTFSSGRVDSVERAIQNFLSSPIIGVGKYYVDNSYVLILAESGLVGLLIIEWIWVTRMIMNLKYRGEQAEQRFLFMMTVFYIVESLLEGFPPFGPGVSSFMYWFLSSVFTNRQKREYHETSEIPAVTTDIRRTCI